MDYKKIIKSREMRIKILKLFNWLPDKTMIKLQYWIKNKRKLDLKTPKRYTEKLQWYKINYRDERMAQCANKFHVRDYIKEKGHEDILNKLYGIYDCVEDIDFDKLPESFVLKATNGGGGNDVIVCTDKTKLNVNDVKQRMKVWTKKEKNGGGREWVYYKYPSQIIAEEYIKGDNLYGLIDYKFFCFNGKVEYLYVVTERKLGQKAKFGIYDRNFVKTPYHRGDEEKMEYCINKPKNYHQMLALAEDLSKDFPHARIDLYEVEDGVRFGEITFFDGSGYQFYEPDEFDYILGDKFILPKERKR